MLFEALLLAHRVYKRDPKKLAEFETKLLCTRNSQHPVMTLIRVAADQPVSLVVCCYRGILNILKFLIIF